MQESWIGVALREEHKPETFDSRMLTRTSVIPTVAFVTNHCWCMMGWACRLDGEITGQISLEKSLSLRRRYENDIKIGGRSWLRMCPVVDLILAVEFCRRGSSLFWMTCQKNEAQRGSWLEAGVTMGGFWSNDNFFASMYPQSSLFCVQVLYGNSVNPRPFPDTAGIQNRDTTICLTARICVGWVDRPSIWNTAVFSSNKRSVCLSLDGTVPLWRF